MLANKQQESFDDRGSPVATPGRFSRPHTRQIMVNRVFIIAMFRRAGCGQRFGMKLYYIPLLSAESNPAAQNKSAIQLTASQVSFALPFFSPFCGSLRRLFADSFGVDHLQF